MRKLLVTGALGHIGSRLLRSISPGSVGKVFLLDNLSTQRYPSLFDLPKNSTYEFIEDDICTAHLEKYFDGTDVVVHLAAITNAEESFSIGKKVEQVNLDGTRRVAEACVACRCKLVFLSTTSVYGSQNDIVDEGCPPQELLAQSPYAESKLAAEYYLQELGEQKGLNFVICRFGTIFGVSPGMRFHTAINKFIWQACNRLPLTVWRTAMQQRRPYLYLGDATAALNFILERDIFDRKIYNVLTTNSTVEEIIHIIGAYVPHVSVEYVDSPIMNQLSYTVSNQRFRDQGFRYNGTLERGIQETIELLAGIRQG